MVRRTTLLVTLSLAFLVVCVSPKASTHTVAQAFPFSVHTQRVSFSCASNGLSVPTFELHDLETNLHTVSLVHAPARSLSILFLKNTYYLFSFFFLFFIKKD